MAKKSQTYEPEAEYEVTLAKPVTIFGQQLLPLHQHEMLGKVIAQIVEENGADVVAHAAPVSH
jgi:hypothetical protein